MNVRRKRRNDELVDDAAKQPIIMAKATFQRTRNGREDVRHDDPVYRTKSDYAQIINAFFLAGL
jgi:hypothetical protein